jgi:hypothetical protein
MEVVKCMEKTISIRRSLNLFPSEHIKAMTKDLAVITTMKGYVEAEQPNMNFVEIMHFFRSEDVTSLKKSKHRQKWKKNSLELSPTLKK